jgi:hypothetical protein
MTTEGFEDTVIPFGPKQEQPVPTPELTLSDFTKDEMTNLNARIVSQLPWAIEGLSHPVFEDMPLALVNALRAASQLERDTVNEKAILIALEQRFDTLLDQEAA